MSLRLSESISATPVKTKGLHGLKWENGAERLKLKERAREQLANALADSQRLMSDEGQERRAQTRLALGQLDFQARRNRQLS